MSNDTPDLFQSVPQIQVNAVDHNGSIMQGLQHLGDSAIAAIDGFLSKLTGLGGRTFGGGGQDVVHSTGRFEDPGFAPSATVVAAAIPARVKGQSIEGPAMGIAAINKNDDLGTPVVGKYMNQDVLDISEANSAQLPSQNQLPRQVEVSQGRAIGSGH